MRPFYRMLAAAALSLLFVIGGVSTASAAHHRSWWRHDNSTNSVPEIDPAALGGAIALLAGGVLMLRDRRR